MKTKLPYAPLSFFFSDKCQYEKLYILSPKDKPEPNSEIWNVSNWIEVSEFHEKNINSFLDAALEYMKREVGGYPGVHDKLPYYACGISEDAKGRWIGNGFTYINGHCMSGSDRGLGVAFDIADHSWIYTRMGVELLEPSKSFRKVIDYKSLGANDFERLIYRLLEEMEIYSNVEWLQHLNAIDSGRDISANCVLTGARVLIQAKHWAGSLGPAELNNLVARAKTWSPAFQKVLVVSSGTYTQDAVRYMEVNNSERENNIHIELWSGGMLEAKLANYPRLVPHG